MSRIVFSAVSGKHNADGIVFSAVSGKTNADTIVFSAVSGKHNAANLLERCTVTDVELIEA